MTTILLTRRGVFLLYKIVRLYFDHNKEREVIKTGLTLDEAKAHCSDVDSMETGVWFDGFDEE